MKLKAFISQSKITSYKSRMLSVFLLAITPFYRGFVFVWSCNSSLSMLHDFMEPIEISRPLISASIYLNRHKVANLYHSIFRN